MVVLFSYYLYYSHSRTERKPTASHNEDLCEMRCGGPDDEDEKIGCHKVGVLLLLRPSWNCILFLAIIPLLV